MIIQTMKPLVEISRIPLQALKWRPKVFMRKKRLTMLLFRLEMSTLQSTISSEYNWTKVFWILVSHFKYGARKISALEKAIHIHRVHFSTTIISILHIHTIHPQVTVVTYRSSTSLQLSGFAISDVVHRAPARSMYSVRFIKVMLCTVRLATR